MTSLILSITIGYDGGSLKFISKNGFSSLGVFLFVFEVTEVGKRLFISSSWRFSTRDFQLYLNLCERISVLLNSLTEW